ncbi:glycosyl hydrolase [Aspergillus pseudodeflectus]|uniref:Glycosyl hydrolase n=1 Tax=Aspergillus pseudodeflectus TaxID=176178 RepID=A0ABR4KSK6_9EURO
MAIFRSLAIALTLGTCASAKWIVPGARWVDTDGNLFNAHAGGLCVDQDTGRLYWFGEYKVEGQVEGGGVSVYSSDDLATWTSHGLALAPIENHTYISPHNRIQRPKVIYSEETGLYHMWWHADDSSYSWLLQGLATSPHIAGPYTFIDATSPLGNWSQDFGAFTDYKTGSSYALYSNGDTVEGRDVYLSKFNSNLTAVEKVTYRFPKYDFEAPTILQTERSYYALMSHKTGYRPNNVVAMRADRLEGPWSQPFFVAPAYTRTFSTQSGFSWRIEGTKKTTYLYMADQWDLNSLWESRNVWLPIEIDDREGSLQVVWHDIYDLNVKTGEWKPIKGKTYIAKHAKLAGGAYFQEATFASGNRIATGIYGNDSTVTFTVQGDGTEQWVSFYHQNIDDMGFGDQPMGQPDRINGTWQLRRISSVVVNGDTDNVHTLYQKDTHKGIILSTPLLLPLKKGPNTLTVGGLWNGFDVKGADLDRVVVYPPEGRTHGHRARGLNWFGVW